MNKNCRIKNFPISFFSIIMGLSGFVIAAQKGIEIYSFNKLVVNYFLYFTFIVFIILTGLYLKKVFSFPMEVKKEFNHPIKVNFFPTFSISLLLLSVAFLGVNLDISKYLWIIGTISHFIFTVIIISAWIKYEKFKISHMNPSWFIPAVGNMIVPIAGVEHFSGEMSWFFFSVGLLFWLILLIVFFYRIFFHEPLPEKLLPTLFILIAPPAVGLISYYKLTGEINDFSRVLYYFSLFLTILIFFQINMFRKIKYYLSWWAYSFPLASISIASALMYHVTKIIAFKYIYLIIFLILGFLILLLGYKTIYSIFKKEICIEE